MWQIVVIMILKGQITTYSLPKEYVGQTPCIEAVARIQSHWMPKEPTAIVCKHKPLET